MIYRKGPSVAVSEIKHFEVFSDPGIERNSEKYANDDLQTELTEKEKKLIHIIRETGYGELKIIVQDTEPVRIEKIRKSIKL